MNRERKILGIGLFFLFACSLLAQIAFVNAAPTINYIDVWSYPDNNWTPQGGTVHRGYTARIYAGITSPEAPVSIGYSPDGISWTTSEATHESTWDYYYIDWAIPNEATMDTYDVKVTTGGVETTSFDRFQVGDVVTSVNYIDVWSYPDNNWISQGGTVNRGHTARIYAGISNPEIPVSIGYSSDGISWTTSVAVHESTWDYYYIDWTIDDDAALGLYDVKVETGVLAPVATDRFQVGEAVTSINYIDAWGYTEIGDPHPGDNWMSQGGTVTIGHVVRLYSYISNPGGSVDISYGPTEGALTTLPASQDATWGYWYIDWTILDSAATGLYDVKVETNGVSSTSTGRLTVAAGLLVDSRLDVSIDDADLRTDGAGQDWYDSRAAFPTGSDTTLLKLDTANIYGHNGKKASFDSSTTFMNAYMTQTFSTSQSGTFSVSYDICIDKIVGYTTYNRAGAMYIGDDRINTNCPTGTSNERFVALVFYDSTPGDTGSDLELRAFSVVGTTNPTWSTTSTWRQLATGLSYDTWYTIKVVVNAAAGTYDVYLDGVQVGTNVPKYYNYSPTIVQFISFSADSEGRGLSYVDNVFAP